MAKGGRGADVEPPFTPFRPWPASGPKPSALHPTNVMPALVDAALANATLGEMVQAMADIYGRYNGGPEW